MTEHIDDAVLKHGPWLRNMLSLAMLYATFSKDPSTGIGCVIFDDKWRIVGGGCNGLSRNSSDSAEILHNRDKKYPRVIHAEENALYNAAKSVEGCSAIITAPPCLGCLHRLDTNGIATIYYVEPSESFNKRWDQDEVVSEANDLGITLESISRQSLGDTVERWYIDGIFVHCLD
jgi:dCMP deaminase